MGARWSDDKIGRRSIPSAGYEDLRDPANGERVPRCLTCGSPTAPITGSFVPDAGQQFAARRFRYRLCLRCIEHANGPQDPDPLNVEAA